MMIVPAGVKVHLALGYTDMRKGVGYTVLAWVREEIDQSIAIVVEAAQILNRANFPLKSRAKKFDGSSVGF